MTDSGFEAEGFQHVLNAYVESRLPRRVRRFVGASDVVQSVYRIAYAQAGQFAGTTPVEYRGWLLRIAENKIIDSLRRYRNRTLPPKVRGQVSALTASEPILRTPESWVSLTEQAHLLLRSISALPEDVRQVIMLRYTREMSFDEIAESLCMSETTVRRRWYEGLERLESHLDVMAE